MAAASRPLRWLAQHPTLCVILFCSFAARLLLADQESYWFDELLSVTTYGTDHDSISSALQTLADEGQHPPLYHAILFYWMQLFGDGEVATRTLSNLYIAGATICLYALAFRLFGRRVAIASALIFAFSYAAISFGLEVRSYPQTLFLVTLSSLLLLRWLEGLELSQTWKSFFNARGLVLLLCNIALLLTHYSNAFFVVVQALFTGVVLWHQNRPASFWPLAKALVFYVLQFAIPFAMWGSVALATRSRAVNEFHIDGLPHKHPLEIFMDLIVTPNFDLPSILYPVLLVLLVIVLAKVAIRHFVRLRRAPPLNAYFLFYLVAWAIVPCIAAYLVFYAAGAERSSMRYFAFCFPPLCILLVLALEQSVESLNGARRVLGFSPSRHYLRFALLYALILCAAFVLPSAYEAATAKKDPYRDIARSIVKLVEGDESSSFMIFEAGPRGPLMNYYLKRFSERVRVAGILGMRTSEVYGRPSRADIEAMTDTSDYVVIAFAHIGAKRFPRLLARFDEDCDPVISQLNKKGIGYIVFKRSPAARAPQAEP